MSMEVGRERLFEPIMAANPDAVVAAAGTSCRHQIADATGKRPQHWAQVLADVVQ